MASLKKLWSVLSTLIVIAVVALAILLAGVRIVGLTPYVVLSGSMEPTYHTGSLIYDKKVDPFTLKEGDVITFMVSEDTLATHRIVGVVPDEDEPGTIRFRTKGDANDAEDAALVHQNNLLGEPVACIPYLGYFAAWVQNPPGSLIAIGAGVFLLALVFLPDVFAKDGEDKKKSGKAGKDSDGSAPQADGSAPDAPDEAAHK